MAAEVIKLTGADGVIGMLQQLPAEVVSKNGGPVKSALRKGGLVILREEALNLARVTNNLTAEEYEGTKLLAKSLVLTRGKAPSDGKGERYLIRIKRKTYSRKGKPVTTLKTAQLLEYGSSTQPAEPWIRPAFQSKAAQAINTSTAELIIGLDRVVKRLAARNGVKS